VAPTITPPTQNVTGKLTDQILAQGTTSKWTGEGFGSAQANAEDMAKILNSVGITDISQFGKITKEVPTYSYDEQGNETFTGMQKVETFGNKLTGQEVGNTYGERQTGDAFGGTYAGKGNTGYRVQFDDKGNPYFYTSGQSSSDAGQWMPIVQLALAATGAGGLLGNALLGAGAGAVATNALGNAIISGALTGAQGGDVATVCEHALTDDGGILINVSRGIIYASSQEDFASKAQDAAKMYQQEMQQFIN
jgi:hypothetical protein